MKTNKKHTFRNFLLIILAVLVVAAGVLAFMYRDVIAQVPRLINGMSHSSEEIASMLEENDKKQNEILNELVEGTMRDLTEEERGMLASGDLSKEDALALIQGLLGVTATTEITTEVAETTEASETDKTASTAETVSDSSDKAEPDPIVTQAVTEESEVTAVTSATSAYTTSTSATTAIDPLTEAEKIAKQNRVSEIIAEIYLLRATYLNKIDELIASAKQKYVDLPWQKRGLKAKLQIVDQYVRPTGNALEKECDAEMNKLLKELKGILTDLGTGTSIIGEIEKTYKEQKEIKMAELYNQYSPKLQ